MKTIIIALGLVALAAPTVMAGEPGPNVITGTAGADDLQGGNSPDVIYGLAGDDIIHGNKGPDEMYGGGGNDRLNGYGSGEARDFLDGGPGFDRCVVTEDDTYVRCEVVRVRKGLGQS